jgi:hypothetical protein
MPKPWLTSSPRSSRTEGLLLTAACASTPTTRLKVVPTGNPVDSAWLVANLACMGGPRSGSRCSSRRSPAGHS